MYLTRREMMVMGGTAAASLCLSGAAEAFRNDPRGSPPAYRLSSRGQRASRAVKIHNANLRFKTRRAADRHRAHPGDNSRIVRLDVSVETFLTWFGGGAQVVDLRKLHART